MWSDTVSEVSIISQIVFDTRHVMPVLSVNWSVASSSIYHHNSQWYSHVLHLQHSEPQIVEWRRPVAAEILLICSLNSKNTRRWSFSQPHLLRTGVQAPLIIANWTLDILWLSWDVLHHMTDNFCLFLLSSSTLIRLVRVSTNGLRGGIGVGMTKLNGDLLYFDGRTEWIPGVMFVMIR